MSTSPSREDKLTAKFKREVGYIILNRKPEERKDIIEALMKEYKKKGISEACLNANVENAISEVEARLR